MFNLLNLVKENKSPFFVLNLNKLNENIVLFKKELNNFFSKNKICYSVKTNSLKEVLSICNENDLGFDVASMQEIELVSNYNSFKVFNSPAKKRQELVEAIKQNAIIVVDCESELLNLIELKEKFNLIRVGFRLNYFNGKKNKFGFSIEQLKKMLIKAKENNLEVEMIHCHPGTLKKLNDYENFLNYYFDALKQINYDFNYINLGSGFPDFFYLKENNLKLRDYFELIKKILGKELKEKTLVFEPGRIIVSNVMILIAKVIRIKKLNEINYAVLNTGINLLPKITLSKYYFSLLNEEEVKLRKEKKQFRIVGPLLFGNDELTTVNASIKENDFVLIENVGAYCLNLSWAISFEKPLIVIQK